MSIKTLHKWLLSITLVLSLTSVHGAVTYQSVYTPNQTELVVIRKTKHNAYFTTYSKQVKSLEKLFTFDFSTFLQFENLNIKLKEHIQLKRSLTTNLPYDLNYWQLMPRNTSIDYIG
jgi:hypothetical protein